MTCIQSLDPTVEGENWFPNVIPWPPHMYFRMHTKHTPKMISITYVILGVFTFLLLFPASSTFPQFTQEEKK